MSLVLRHSGNPPGLEPTTSALPPQVTRNLFRANIRWVTPGGVAIVGLTRCEPEKYRNHRFVGHDLTPAFCLVKGLHVRSQILQHRRRRNRPGSTPSSLGTFYLIPNYCESNTLNVAQLVRVLMLSEVLLHL